MQREGVFREMKRRKGKTVRAQDPREGRSHPTRTQGRQETGPARRPDPHAQTAGACAPSGAAAQVLSLLRTRSCAARSADVESRTECAAPVCGKRTKNGPAFKRCRIAISKKGAMTDESPRTKPEKLPKTKLAELRAAPQCGAAVHVTVVPYDNYRVGAIWEVASCNPGAFAPEACERALCDIIRRLQQHFDIAPT